jgi:two-component system sensor kinase FixL
MSDGTHFESAGAAASLLAAIADSSDDAIIGKDLEGVIRTWNRAAEHLYGYSAREVKGRSIALLIPEGRRDELADILGKIRSGQSVMHLETVRQTKDGRLLDVSIRVTPVRDAGGTIIGAATIARDVTANKRLEERVRRSEARWRSVIESAVDGIVVIDGRGHIESFNPAAERLFGYAESEVIGRNVNMLMPSPHHEEHDTYIARYLATREKRIIGLGREVIGVRRDGTTFPVHLSVGEMIIEGQPKFTGILHDLSARMRIEEQLRERAAMARLGEMAAVIAHEIKNPLAGIRGAIQVIGSRLPADSPDAAIAKEIVTRIDGLNNLMKDLLLFARPPQLHPASVDVAALIASTAGLLAQDPAMNGVRVEIEGIVPPLMGDPELLRIVFVNLLVNGAQAMMGEGVIRVSLETSDQSCRITIEDRGPGIPADVRQRMFVPFFTTKTRGTGLGLPTAKKIIEAHAGTIAVECPPGGGTHVTLELPVS